MRILIFLFLVLYSAHVKADQLAYISEEHAKQAVLKINKLKYVYLFCGCCSIEKPEKVKVISAYTMNTGYQDYYEVYIQCEREDGSWLITPLDLAYVWKKGIFGAKTIGQILGLEHDPCVTLSDWDNPKYVEKDI